MQLREQNTASAVCEMAPAGHGEQAVRSLGISLPLSVSLSVCLSLSLSLPLSVDVCLSLYLCLLLVALSLLCVSLSSCLSLGVSACSLLAGEINSLSFSSHLSLCPPVSYILSLSPFHQAACLFISVGFIFIASPCVSLCLLYAASGRLGLGHNRGALVPAIIESLLQQQVVFVAAGESHSAALDRKGCTYTWGSGAFYRLGHGDEADCPTPRIIESLGGIPIMQVRLRV